MRIDTTGHPGEEKTWGLGAREQEGDGGSRKLSVDILLANPGGFELCMRGVVAAGGDNPTSGLVPRVSLGHMVTSCKHAPWGTTAWGCVGGRKVCGETRLGETCVCAGRLHLCRPVFLHHVRRAFQRPLRPFYTIRPSLKHRVAVTALPEVKAFRQLQIHISHSPSACCE